MDLIGTKYWSLITTFRYPKAKNQDRGKTTSPNLQNAFKCNSLKPQTKVTKVNAFHIRTHKHLITKKKSRNPTSLQKGLFSGYSTIFVVLHEWHIRPSMSSP